MTAAMETGGLATFGLTVDEAAQLARGKRLNVAKYCVQFGFYEDARDLLARIAAEDPEGMLYRMWLVWAYLGCGQVGEADRLSAQLLADFPEKQRVLGTRSEVLFTLGDYDGGREVFLRFSVDPTQAYSYWARLAVSAQRRGEWDLAREALDRAVGIFRERQEENPEDSALPAYLWTAVVRQGEYDGTDVTTYRSELEEMRREQELKVREALEKPDPQRREPTRNARRVPLYDQPQETAEPEASPTPPEPCPPNPGLESELREYFGFPSFRAGQQQVVEHVLAGKSVLAIMPTGGGKSLCYQLPAMLMDGVTLVVSPLIALMKDQVDGLPAAVQAHATLINSTLEGDEIERRMRDIGAGKYRLVYAAPERLRQRPFLHALKRRGVSVFVVDEAHCVSMWGHDFRPDYLFIGEALRYLSDPTVLSMTATANPSMRLEIADHFGRQFNVISTGTHRPNLFLESVVVRTDEEKMRALMDLCRETEGPGIVYVRSRLRTEQLSRLLRREGVRATYYHAGLEDEQRAATHEAFMDGRYRVICATVAFGMGIDKPDVRFVIHYSPPQSLEDYYQEAGRAGRDGQVSRCVLLCTPSDKALITRWMHSELMDIDLPRQCYQFLREITPDSPYAAVHSDEFARELQQDETRVRVAISMLEAVGLVKRHLDVPTTANVSLTAKGACEDRNGFAEFVRNARLKTGQRLSLETLDLSERTGRKPEEIEENLLDWRDCGCLTYRGSGRVMLLERLPAPRHSRHALEQLLAKYAAAQEARAVRMARYTETRRCRHEVIAAHFGERYEGACSSCDNCIPTKQPRAQTDTHVQEARIQLTDAQKRRKILETVRMVSGQVGYTGLVRLLKGSVASHIKRDRCSNFGIFAGEPKGTIERWVRELLDEEALVRDDSEYRLISLGKQGTQELLMDGEDHQPNAPSRSPGGCVSP